MGGLRKQFEILGGRPLFLWAAQRLALFAQVRELVCVVPAEEVEGFYCRWMEKYGFQGNDCDVKVVAGGASREESVSAGLAALADSCDYVLIHDAARPFLSDQLIDDVFVAAVGHGAATAAVPSKDTIKISTDGSVFAGTPERSHLWQIQTPQCFRREWIVAAHLKSGSMATDDTVKVEALGHSVQVVMGDYRNFKLTTPEDMIFARALSGEEKSEMLRIGQGWDLHRLEEGRRLVIGGVEIPFNLGLVGHSDADVLIHAIIDALLGGAALGNIGLIFSDRDPTYHQADSTKLLEIVGQLLHENNYRIVNIDSTVVAEAPRLAEYLPKMQSCLATTLGIDTNQISIKAKTGEKVDAVGRGEAMAAQAVCILQREKLRDLTNTPKMSYPLTHI
jgi:2-C-methyl-D-erythritol 4-phosphate cytidylyltransferase/2-C-methyl-D-erythritol 2,4-cyclodiphosphate synthase